MPMSEHVRASGDDAYPKVRNVEDVEAGEVVPVQTATGGLEGREVAAVERDGDYVFLAFTDGSGWAWNAGDPVIVHK